MRFSPEFIDKVREASDIVEIIGQYTELKGSGSRLMGRCPFPDHPDRSPSFSVSEDQQLYNCFGCKKGGNVFTFLDTFNGMSFPEAIEYLARRASIPLPDPEPGKPRGSSDPNLQKDVLLKVNKTAAVYFHRQMKNLPKEDPVWAYAEKRGLAGEVFEKFRIGFATAEWQGLYTFFNENRVPIVAAEKLGLIKPKKVPKAGDSHFDLFRERLMFPIFSSAGDVIGFGGRTLDPEGLPKYLNSHDSPVFNKGRVFYGLHETGKFIRALDFAIVVEGYMDAIALYSAGIKNVVAILGTAFTPDHAKVLKRYSQNVTMLLDGDEAGLTGAERSLPILLEAGLTAKGFLLPNKMDPDDFVKAQGAEKLQDEMARAPELFVLLLAKRWMQDYHGSSSDKVKVTDEAVKILAKIQNRSLAELYILEIARQIDVDAALIRKALAQFVSQNGGPQISKPGEPRKGPVLIAPVAPKSGELPPPEPELEVPEFQTPTKIILKGAPREEIFVVSLVLHHEALLVELLAAGPEETYSILSHAGVRELLRLAVKKYQARPEAFTEVASSLVAWVDDPALLMLASARGKSDEKVVEGLEKRLLGDYLGSIRLRTLKARAKALALQIRTAEIQGEPQSPARQQKLEEFMALKRDILELERR